MKILIVECTAEELSANRTIMDTLTDALSSFSESLVGARLSSHAVSAALAKMNEEGQDDENVQ